MFVKNKKKAKQTNLPRPQSSAAVWTLAQHRAAELHAAAHRVAAPAHAPARLEHRHVPPELRKLRGSREAWNRVASHKKTRGVLKTPTPHIPCAPPKARAGRRCPRASAGELERRTRRGGRRAGHARPDDCHAGGDGLRAHAHRAHVLGAGSGRVGRAREAEVDEAVKREEVVSQACLRGALRKYLQVPFPFLLPWPLGCS